MEWGSHPGLAAAEDVPVIVAPSLSPLYCTSPAGPLPQATAPYHPNLFHPLGPHWASVSADYPFDDPIFGRPVPGISG